MPEPPTLCRHCKRPIIPTVHGAWQDADNPGYEVCSLTDDTGPSHEPESKEKEDTDIYSITVRFERSRTEDLEIAKTNFPKLSDDHALLEQFVLELQSMAYDDGGMAGQWQLVTSNLQAPLDSWAGMEKAMELDSTGANSRYPDDGDVQDRLTAGLLITRKKHDINAKGVRSWAGSDCTDDESAWIKGYFDRHHPENTPEGRAMAEAYPLERDEWFQNAEERANTQVLIAHLGESSEYAPGEPGTREMYHFAYPAIVTGRFSGGVHAIVRREVMDALIWRENDRMGNHFRWEDGTLVYTTDDDPGFRHELGREGDDWLEVPGWTWGMIAPEETLHVLDRVPATLPGDGRPIFAYPGEGRRPATHWFWQVGNQWMAVVGDAERDTWWDEAERPDVCELPIEQLPPDGHLVFLSLEGDNDLCEVEIKRRPSDTKEPVTLSDEERLFLLQLLREADPKRPELEERLRWSLTEDKGNYNIEEGKYHR